jgi:hypothetical protein
MAISAEDRRRYARVQAQVEAIIEEIAAADAFIFASRDPNTGRSAATSWERDSSWKRDQIRFLASWTTAGSGYRTIYTDVTVRVRVADGTLIDVDGYPARWIARQSTEDLRIRQGWEQLPPKLASTIRDDLTRGLAWLDARYGTPALTIEMLQSPERNGVGIGTEPYRAVCAALSRLAKD